MFHDLCINLVCVSVCGKGGDGMPTAVNALLLRNASIECITILRQRELFNFN